MKYAFIEGSVREFTIGRLCEVLHVSRSGYYAWRGRPIRARAVANTRLLARMQQLHQQTKARYGAVKLWRALRLAGIPCGRHRVARLRRQHGLLAQRVRRFRVMIEHHQFAPRHRTDFSRSLWPRPPIGSGQGI